MLEPLITNCSIFPSGQCIELEGIQRKTSKKTDGQHQEGHGGTRNKRSGCTGQRTVEESVLAPYDNDDEYDDKRQPPPI